MKKLHPRTCKLSPSKILGPETPAGNHWSMGSSAVLSFAVRCAVCPVDYGLCTVLEEP